jgi:CheY-like chemotaxis protein
MLSTDLTQSVALPILLAEDDENDVFFMERAVEKAGISNRLIVARDGVEAVEYLKGEGAYADREIHPLPGIILLDLKMPRMNGFDVLTWLQSRSELSMIPVVVLSSSELGSDIIRANSLGAKEYRVKPSGTEELKRMVEEWHARWLTGPPGTAGSGLLTPAEKQQLTSAILTIADPKGNRTFGWQLLCELAGLDPSRYESPFKTSPGTS